MGLAQGEITQLLAACRRDGDALDRLIPLVIEELRHLAAHYLAREHGDHTLQPTALVNEVYLRLANGRAEWENRGQFFAFAARLMREILVDHARARLAAKRGCGTAHVRLEEALHVLDREVPDLVMLIAVGEALNRLGRLDARQRQIVELRYFCGLTLKEIAVVLEVSLATVERGWSMARRWLVRELRGPDRSRP